MKKLPITTYLLILLSVMFLASCSTLKYEASDGTKVSYNRFLTSTDSIKGEVKGASVEVGKTSPEMSLIEALITVLNNKKSGN